MHACVQSHIYFILSCTIQGPVAPCKSGPGGPKTRRGVKLATASWGQSPSVLGDSDKDSDSVASVEESEAVATMTPKSEEQEQEPEPEQKQEQKRELDDESAEDEPLLSLMPRTKVRILFSMVKKALRQLNQLALR